MKKLNELVKSNNVKGYGFKAIVNYCEINADKNGQRRQKRRRNSCLHTFSSFDGGNGNQRILCTCSS